MNYVLKYLISQKHSWILKISKCVKKILVNIKCINSILYIIYN
jgi:hypothetical protein